MTGQLESIDEFKSIVHAAAEAGVDAKEVSFTDSCVSALKSALPATERKNFQVDHYLIQWNSPKPTNFVPAALVRYLHPFAEFLQNLYRYYAVWDEFKAVLSDHYDEWKGKPHHEIHENVLRKLLPADRFDNSDLALFAEWLAPPENHILKPIEKDIINVEKSGKPKPRSASDLFPGAVVNLLRIKNDGGGKGLGTLAFHLAEAEILETITSPVNFIVNGKSDEAAKSDIPSKSPRNLIYYGAPGTGKSHEAEQLIECEHDHFHRVVFHPDYQNADFIGSIKPAIQGGRATYEYEKGPFTEALVDALRNPDSPVVLLIEELNRGNAASIFGETFQLLDRSANGESKYPIRITGSFLEAFQDIEDIYPFQRLSLPPNFFIIATMNTSDQAVFPLDTAFKRRWTMKHVPIDWRKVSDPHSEYAKPKIRINGEDHTWAELGQAINSVMESSLPNVPEDRYLGPFFLSPDELLLENLNEVISGKVLIYLWDDVVRYEQKQALFAENITTFQLLQERFNRGEDVFSIEVNQRLSELALQRSIQMSDSGTEYADEEKSTDPDIS